MTDAVDDREMALGKVPEAQFLAYLVRHAEPNSWGDETLRYDIPPGPPLSLAGQAQALRAGEFLSGNPPAAIYASPLQRACETAQIIGDCLGVAPVVDPRIAEHRRDETAAHVSARVLDFWNERLSHSPMGRIALISHGSPIRLLLASLSNGLQPGAEYSFDFGNIVPLAGIWCVTSLAPAGRSRHWNVGLVFPDMNK